MYYWAFLPVRIVKNYHFKKENGIIKDANASISFRKILEIFLQAVTLWVQIFLNLATFFSLSFDLNLSPIL